MGEHIAVTQAREELAELVNRVAYGKERIVLTRHGKPVAALVSHDDLALLEQRDRGGADQARHGEQVIRLTDAGDTAGPETAHGSPHATPAEPLRIAAERRRGQPGPSTAAP